MVRDVNVSVKPHRLATAAREGATMRIRTDTHNPESQLPGLDRPGLSSRLGGRSAAHWKRTVVLWLAFVLLAGSLAGATKKLTDADSTSGESSTALRILDDANFKQPANESVLVQSATLPATAQAFRRAIGAVELRLRAFPQVTRVRSPLDGGGLDLVSKDGRSALIQFDMRGKADKAHKQVQPVLDAVAAEQRANPGFRIEEFGKASADKKLNDTVGKDFTRAETLSIPITFLILLVAFGALVAALVPVALALTSIVAATGLVGVTSHAFPVDSSTSSILLLIGLAVGVDYSLFYIRREREERARGNSPKPALQIAAGTSGRSVLISGLTVIVAMIGLLLTGQGIFMGIATGTAVVVAVAVLGSLTVLPALMSGLGDRIDFGRLPFRRRRDRGGESRFWTTVLRPVLRHPAVSALVAGAILVALAVPAFRLHTAVLGANDIPQNLPIMKTFQRIQKAFPGGPLPARVVVSAKDVTAPAVAQGISALRTKALATGLMHEPITVRTNPAHTVAVVDVPLTGDGVDTASQQSLHVLRNTVIPETLGAAGAKAYVAGPTATSVDFSNQLDSRTPAVFVFVLALAFLLLLWAFRSLVIASTAIVLNLLSVGAAYGVLVAVFQWGWGKSLLGVSWNGAISSWLPLFLFVILFGLSMDYHVFILSRIREARDHGMSTREAVAYGITSSAGVVTSAAIVMVAVFATFATLSVVSLKQLGVGLAVAVLLDATLVRAVLLPATMALLGERNWYLPRWLQWMPRQRIEADEAAAVDAEPAIAA
jgi:RND superfamily putative drug exporter